MDSLEKHRGGSVRAAVREKFIQAVRDEVAEKKLSVPKAFAEEWFLKLNIEPVFAKQKTAEFADMRHKLNTESGILIANHPGGAESLILAGMVERTDVKILIEDPTLASQVSKIFGQDYALTVPKFTEDPENRQNRGIELMRMVQDIQDHIRKGGLVVFYPTAGREEAEPFMFENLFGLLIQRVLKHEDMVYACWINEDDVGSVANERISRGKGAFSDTMFPPVNINALKSKKLIRVDERYSKASEWQHLVQNVASRDERSTILTTHFLDAFEQKDIPESA